METKILSVAVSEDVWKEIKKIAALRGKSVSALVREQLESIVEGTRKYEEAHRKLREIAEKRQESYNIGREKIFMTFEAFFDTNVLAYEYDLRNLKKQSVAKNLLTLFLTLSL